MREEEEKKRKTWRKSWTLDKIINYTSMYEKLESLKYKREKRFSEFSSIGNR